MTIPASSIVKINPGVVTAGGAGLVLNGLFLTENLAMPTSQVLSFVSAAAVADFFGASSTEALAAAIYFNGYENSTLSPSSMLFAAYNSTARSAFMSSGTFASTSLAQLQALGGGGATGSIGATFTASAGSPTTQLVVTAVTGLISIGDTISGTGITPGTTILSQISGTPGGAGTYGLSAANTASAATVTSFGTVLNITAVASGVLNSFCNITGTGVTAGTTITGQLSGTPGGIGLYSISTAPAAYVASGSIVAGLVLNILVDGVLQTSALINLSGQTSFSAAAAYITSKFTGGPTVTFNSITSAFEYSSTTTGTGSSIAFATGGGAIPLQLTSATGARLSQGAAVDTPGSAMTNAYNASQNWVSMVTLFEPSLSNKELFAAWFNAQDYEFLWLAWDSDVQACVQNATEPFGVVAKLAEYNGVACIGGDPAAVPAGNTLAQMVMNIAIFVAGAIGSINFGETNGRTALAFLSQPGLLPTCANAQTAANLLANGYSFYGGYTTRNQGFTFFYNGQLPGAFDWIDTFVDDTWMNDQFQVTLMTLLATIGSVAYNAQGYGVIRNALVNGPIAAALNFGAIRTGVVLSSTQVADVNQTSGVNAASVIQTLGYYLQILDPGATVRQERGSPIINFWYTDGGSIQFINMSSLDLL